MKSRTAQTGTTQSSSANDVLNGSQDFSLVLGGPLFQLLRRVHLSDDTLMLARRRIIFIALFAWLPLLVLSTLEGQLLPGTSTVPFLLDMEVHIRLLVALPLLIAAELVVHQRMRSVVSVFQERQLVPDNAQAQFNAAITSAFRLRNSMVAEVLLIAIVYIVGVLIIWRNFIALDAATWYARPSGGETLAGMWYGFISVPVFQFLLVRWYFRIFIWIRFLWQVSRIKLNLVPTHPDRVGGLGFLAKTVQALSLLAVAHGAMLAGTLANRIFFLGTELPQYKAEIALMVILMLSIILIPLLVFAPQLAQAKRTGLREYGTLAYKYVHEFDIKWLRGGAPKDEAIVGSADIQSLADLGNSFEVIQGMRSSPFTKETIIQVAFATLAPVAPLALTMMPLDLLIKTLLGVLL